MRLIKLQVLLIKVDESLPKIESFAECSDHFRWQLKLYLLN